MSREQLSGPLSPDQNPETRREYTGVLHLFSESGTEGGYWALQDERFINKTQANYGVFGNKAVFDASNPTRKGRTQEKAEILHGSRWDPLPDPVQEEPDYLKSSLFRGEQSGDREADQRLMDKYGFTIQYAADRMDEEYGKNNWRLENPHTAVTSDGTRVAFGGTPSTTPDRPYGLRLGDITKNNVEWEDGTIEERLSTTLLQEQWSYDGLHILKDGDKLTIYDKYKPDQVIWEGEISLQQYGLFTQDAFGMWIHTDQQGIERNTWAEWFFNDYRARLIPRDIQENPPQR